MKRYMKNRNQFLQISKQPMKHREQKPNLFGLCRVATEEDEVNYAAKDKVDDRQLILDFGE